MESKIPNARRTVFKLSDVGTDGRNAWMLTYILNFGGNEDEIYIFLLRQWLEVYITALSFRLY